MKILKWCHLENQRKKKQEKEENRLKWRCFQELEFEMKNVIDI